MVIAINREAILEMNKGVVFSLFSSRIVEHWNIHEREEKDRIIIRDKRLLFCAAITEGKENSINPSMVLFRLKILFRNMETILKYTIVPKTTAKESVIDKMFSFNDLGNEKLVKFLLLSFFIAEKEIMLFFGNINLDNMNRIKKELPYKQIIKVINDEAHK